MRANDIGSIYPIDSVVPSLPCVAAPRAGFRAERDIRFFALCREALGVLARRHATPGGRRVLLPAYTCQTVIDPFVENGWSCAFYGVDLNLHIDLDSLLSTGRAFDPNLVVVHPYCGMGLTDRELDALAQLKQPGRLFVEDLTQCIFSAETNGVFDYYTGSLRKWMAMPDGAFLSTDRPCGGLDDEMPAEEHAAYVSVELAAMRLRGEYYASSDEEVKTVSRHVDKAAQALICDTRTPHAMSRYAQSVLAQADFGEIISRRRANYTYFFEHLHTSAATPVCRDLSRVTSAPLYFPILAADRTRVHRALIAENVYAPILWPVLDSRVFVTEDVRTVYDRLLALPIDQRYSESDMERICSVLNAL